jgi:hypothetical protein
MPILLYEVLPLDFTKSILKEAPELAETLESRSRQGNRTYFLLLIPQSLSLHSRILKLCTLTSLQDSNSLLECLRDFELQGRCTILIRVNGEYGKGGR